MNRYVETLWDALEWKPPIGFGGFCYFGNAYSLNVIVWLSHSANTFFFIHSHSHSLLYIDFCWFYATSGYKNKLQKKTMNSLEKNKNAD